MPEPDHPPGPPPREDDHQRRRREREELVRLANASIERQSYTRVRQQTRQDLGAGPTPDRGPAGCLALLVVPLGLLLLTVHPLPGMLMLSLGAGLYLAGSHRLERSRRLLEQAEAEARQRWLDPGEHRQQS